MWAVIEGPKVTLHQGKPSLAQMQEAVGGYIEAALHHPSPRKHITVDAWVNEEGLLIGLPIQYRRSTDGSLLAGTIVITATNERTGNTVEATEDEIAAIQKYLEAVAPITEYEFEPQYKIEFL